MENENVKLPNPEDLFSEASGTVENSSLYPYLDTVVLLRARGFSWRGIAKWFTERGISISHTSVKSFYDNLKSDKDLENEYHGAMERAKDVIMRRGHPRMDLHEEREEEENLIIEELEDQGKA